MKYSYDKSDQSESGLKVQIGTFLSKKSLYTRYLHTRCCRVLICAARLKAMSDEIVPPETIETIRKRFHERTDDIVT